MRAALGWRSVLAGVGMAAAYALVLSALERAEAAPVAAIRETSVVMATVAAAVLGRERVPGTRIAARSSSSPASRRSRWASRGSARAAPAARRPSAASPASSAPDSPAGTSTTARARAARAQPPRPHAGVDPDHRARAVEPHEVERPAHPGGVDRAAVHQQQRPPRRRRAQPGQAERPRAAARPRRARARHRAGGRRGGGRGGVASQPIGRRAENSPPRGFEPTSHRPRRRSAAATGQRRTLGCGCRSPIASRVTSPPP